MADEEQLDFDAPIADEKATEQVEKPTEQVEEEKPAPKKAVAKASKSEPTYVIYESRNPEPKHFDVAGIRSTRNFDNGRLEWKVAADDVERFEQNFHFVRQRIVRKAAQ